MSKRDNIRCPNCNRKVKYASEHARGVGEFNVNWVCKKK